MKSMFANVLKITTVSSLVLGGWSQVYGVLIQDGGFDTTTTISTGVPTAPSQEWFIKDVGVNQYATWAIVDGYAVATPGQVNSWGSADNIQALRQSYIDVNPNTWYTLSFDYQTIGAGFSGDNVGVGTTDPLQSELQLQVHQANAGGTVIIVDTLGNANIGAATTGWTHTSYSFLTGANTESINLKFGALFAANSQGRDSILVDNVSVPDGGMTMTLLGLGMAGLGLLRRKLS
ncbi:MAG: hypothetical protein WCI95_10215 [bacterium]